jgi:hypothetical protein
MANAQDSKTIKDIKAWASPLLAIGLWTLMYSDIRELKSDVKELMQYKIYLEQAAKGKISHNLTTKERQPFKHEDIYYLDQQLHS